MNRVEIRGGLVRDPDYRFVGDGGTALLEMTVAVNGTRYDRTEGKQVVKTTFVSVQAWGVVADEVMNKYGLAKGDEVYVLGELDQREVEKADGTKERKTRVTAFMVTALRARHAHQTIPSQQEPPPGNPF